MPLTFPGFLASNDMEFVLLYCRRCPHEERASRSNGREYSKMDADGMTIAWSVDGSGDAGQGSATIGSSSRALAAPDDRALIERAQGGDREAFEALVHRYDRDVLRIALNILHKTRRRARRLPGSLPQNLQESAPFPLRVQLLHLDVPRRDQRLPRSSAPPQQPAGRSGARTMRSTRMAMLPAPIFSTGSRRQRASSNPERRLMGLEIGQRISTALERLTPRERMVFEMKHYQGLKLRAIGDALGTSEETVKNSLFRATRKLREQLEGLL